MKPLLKIAAVVVAAACAATAQAQTLVDEFSYAGGALNPASYESSPNRYRPAALNPDATSDAGGSIVLGGLTSGGLGSSNFEEGYGGFYTFFSTDVTLSYQTTDILAGVETVTLTFLAGGEDVYEAGDLTLGYNVGAQGLTTGLFTATPAGSVETPIGPTNMMLYSWTWNVSGLGSITALNVNWSAGTHEFFDQITVTQAVPEPSTYFLIGLGLLSLVVLRRRTIKCTSN